MNQQQSTTINATTSPSSTSSAGSTSSSRFSLILLEPGEICFEDFLVYYSELVCPFDIDKQQNKFQYQQKGSLKICSKSIVFDPLNLNYPLVKFPYKSFEKIVKFDDENDNKDATSTILSPIKQLTSNNSLDLDSDSIYSSDTSNRALVKELDQIKQKCFAINTKQVIHCKINNKIAPYKIIKRENPTDMHYFQFIFKDVNDSLQLLEQLHRASTLDFEKEDLMIQLALKSCLNRNLTFDHNVMDDMFKEQIQFECQVNKINPLVTNPGKVFLTNMCLYFKPFNNVENEQQMIKIKLGHVKFVIKRRYHLKRVGCEIVFDKTLNKNNKNSSNDDTNDIFKYTSSTSKLPYLYLTFDDESTRDLFYTRLVVEQRDKLVNLNEFSQDNMLQKWRFGAISNFEYLMYLNNSSDRSYNDLTQYPVFPWVITDYTSDKLDLSDPNVYRDLSKPIGALNEERLNRLKQRCHEMQATTTTFDDADSSQQHHQQIFLYGSHYSTPAFVLFYLVRQYPEWQLCLQNGRFDHPNRLFHSIADTWRNCLTIDSDVKELIPEFYDTNVEQNIDDLDSDISYDLGLVSSPQEKLGSFLKNNLELDLGVRSDGLRVNHVILPKWANNSTKEFILKMREALESPFISENLHKWIDLIFGYKQRGEEAIKADNLFYYLCYEGAIDLQSIKSYSERKSLEIQIQEFGQIPTQLFSKPHLPRSKMDPLGDVSLLSFSKEQEELDDRLADNLLEKFNNSIDMNSGRYSSHSPKLSSLSSYRKRSSTSHSDKSFQSPFKLCAANFNQLTVKLEVKNHKGQVNDCLFIEPNKNLHSTDSTKSKSPNEQINQNLPFVCSVSNDNWIKIYSLEDRSVFRSHNVSDFNLSSVDCIQIASTDMPPLYDEENEFDKLLKDYDDDYEHIEMDQILKMQQQETKTSQTSPISSAGQTQFSRTLLFLSCWDNSIYVYDMNYNRCIYTLNNCHEDALSRIKTKLIKRKITKPSTKPSPSSLILASSVASKIEYTVSFYVISSSWDSQIKLWRIPTNNQVKYQLTKRKLSISNGAKVAGKSEFHYQQQQQQQQNQINLLNSDSIKLQLSNELSHDSAINDFTLSKSYLASICKDGNLYLWKLSKSKGGRSVAHTDVSRNLVDNNSSDHELDDIIDDDKDGFDAGNDSYEENQNDGVYHFDNTATTQTEADDSAEQDDTSIKNDEYAYSFVYAIQASADDIGKITDCKIIEVSSRKSANDYQQSQQQSFIHTLAICTSLGYLKIYNLKTKCELFSLKINVPQTQANAKLNKIYYTSDYIITIDSNGYIYFIDLKQQQLLSATSSISSFLSHTIKLTSNSLTCLSIYNEMLICVGDSAGNLYFLSLFDF